MGRLERQREAFDKARQDMDKSERISQGVNARNNYLDELNKNLDNMADTETEKNVFDKTSQKGLLDKPKNWWD